MPSYRGIPQADLLRSINDALSLLETHSTGPECQKRIDALRAVDPATGQSDLGAIAAATDDASLAQAMRGSGVFWLFSRAHDVFAFHAANDTDGKGQDVVKRLLPWGAMDAAMTAEYNKFDEETDGWLAARYAHAVEPNEENLEKIAMVTQALSQDRMAVMSAFDTITKMVEMAHSGADDDKLREKFLALGPHARYVALKSISAIMLLDGVESDMDFTPAIRRYCVVIDDLTDKKIKWTHPAVDAVRSMVEDALGPFYDLDEVTTTGIGKANMDRPEMGIIFDATARAAQAVATALPNMKVLDGDGNVMPPRTRPKPKDPGFRL
ncbi:MAG: hypothetical protein GC185_13445 [Alphaproteobacteria bacterium]|nr:hypothetical protein [Alphaproteobacteria bacterium]